MRSELFHIFCFVVFWQELMPILNPMWVRMDKLSSSDLTTISRLSPSSGVLDPKFLHHTSLNSYACWSRFSVHELSSQLRHVRSSTCFLYDAHFYASHEPLWRMAILAQGAIVFTRLSRKILSRFHCSFVHGSTEHYDLRTFISRR